MNERPHVHALPFVTHERPHCVWSLDPANDNLRFLDSLDPGYFESVATALAPRLESDDRQHAAMAIRALYSQAQETFFALVGSMLQAPHCVFGWMHRYSNADLDRVVAAIRHGTTLLHLHRDSRVDWYAIAATILNIEAPPDEQADLQRHFAGFWIRSTDEFLNPSHRSEYNAIKHGLRARPGGFSLTMRSESAPGVVDPQGAGIRFPLSEFGSSHIQLRELRRKDPNLEVGWCNRNWSPTNMLHGIELLAMSARNVCSHLRAQFTPGERWTVEAPENFELFDKPWVPSSSVIESRGTYGLRIADDSLFATDTIRAIYERTSSTGERPG